MRLPRILADSFAVLVLVGAMAPARAERVAPLMPSIEPPPAQELKNRFHDAVGRGLQQGGRAGDAVPGADVRTRLNAAEDLLRCSGGPCLQKALGELRVDRLVLTELTISGKTYNFTLRLIDQGGQEVWRTSDRCDICTVREADEAVAAAAARVTAWMAKAGATDKGRTVAAAKQPPAAETQRKPPPPEAQGTQRKPPPLAETPPPPVQALRQPSELDREQPGAQPQPEAYRPYYKYAWITSLTVGLAMVVGSAPFWYYVSLGHGTTCGTAVTTTRCSTIYNYNANLGAAAGLLGGGVLIGGGLFAAFYYLDRREHKRATHLSLVPISGGAMAGLEGLF